MISVIYTFVRSFFIKSRKIRSRRGFDLISPNRNGNFAKKNLKRVVLGNGGSKVRLGGSILKTEIRMSGAQ